jgi:N-acetylneuraminic acid mutarotase
MTYLRDMRRVAWIPALLTLATSAQTWTQLPDFPGTARDDAATFTINDKIYVGTGMEVGWGLTTDWWCFDRATASWTAIAPLPAAPRQYCTGFNIVDTGYVFGGVDANGALDELWAYHPETNSWEQKASLPAEARYASVSTTGYYGDAIVATGLLASGDPTNEAWKYHANNDTWEPMAPVPGPARHRAACFLGAGGMVIAGGADSSFAPLADAWSYPIWFETGEWYPETDLPAPRWNAEGSGGNTPVVIGGATAEGTANTFPDAWSFDETEWHALPSFPGGPRRGGIAASGPDNAWTGTLYFGLGLDGAERHKDWWMLEFPLGLVEHDVPRIGLFPNPATNSVTLSWPDNRTQAQVHILDNLGRIISRLQVNNGSPLDVHGLQPGNYTLVVQHGAARLHGSLVKIP